MAVNIKSSHILIVDDVIDNLHLLADMLETHNHKVDIASSGREALEKIETSPPDLILLDIQMPGMTGYEVCQRVKANPSSQDIPVIFLSALSETGDILKGFEVGGVDYVPKPFQMREIVARVQSQLALSQQRREIEEMREREKQQFESLAEMKNTFLRATAHDLKNPLTGVLLYAQMLRNTPPEDTAGLRELADGIEQSARKMQGLATDILDLAQLQMGSHMNFIELPLQAILQQVIKNMDVLAQAKNIRLILKQPDETIKMPVDKSYFERMLDNLVSNAIKYTPDGGQVELAMQITESCLLITVSDTGLGIPKEDLPHIFEAFYRVKKASHKKENGSGLGLSIVAAIAEEHGGEITVESEEGEGTRFSIKFN